ncbi:MAG TPA: hypothetical protein PLD55_12460 [bacterium]|nr:hypothetical protein [bacterium]
MKLKVNNTDISDVVFSLSGLEFRQNIEGGIVIPEIEFSTNQDYAINTNVKIYDEADKSIFSGYIAEKNYNYDDRLYEYVVKDKLSKMQDKTVPASAIALCNNIDQTFSTFSNWPYLTTYNGTTYLFERGDFELFPQNQVYYLPVIQFLKFCLYKSGIALADIIFNPTESHIDGIYEIYDGMSSDERNIIKAPFNHLCLSFNQDYLNENHTYLDLFNLVLQALDLYLVYYNDKYYFKKNSSFAQPGNDLIFSIENETLPVYDYIEAKKNAVIITYPNTTGAKISKNDLYNVSFYVMYRMSDSNIPYATWSYVSGTHSGRFFVMKTENTQSADEYCDLKLDNNQSVFTTIASPDPVLAWGSSGKQYTLYYPYTKLCKNGATQRVKRKIETLYTDAWTSSSVEPLSVSIDIQSKTKEIEVLI